MSLPSKKKKRVAHTSRTSLPTSIGILLNDYGDLENFVPNVVSTKEPIHIVDVKKSFEVAKANWLPKGPSPTRAGSKISTGISLTSVSSKILGEYVGENMAMNEQSQDSKGNVLSRRSGTVGSVSKRSLKKSSSKVSGEYEIGESENIPMNEQDRKEDPKESLRLSRRSDSGRKASKILEEASKIMEAKHQPSETSSVSEEASSVSGEWSYEEVSNVSKVPEEIKGETLSSDKIPKPSEEDEDINKCYDYGEPPRYQHIRYDFTPIKGVDDNEELLQKCVDFWNFVHSSPELKQMMVEPVIQEKVSTAYELVENIPKEKTALQWNADLPLAMGHLSIKYCMEPTKADNIWSEKNSEAGDSCSESRMWTLKLNKEGVNGQTYKHSMVTPRADKETKELNEEMDDFDRKHPKSFDPPRLRQGLITAEMQRLPPVSYSPFYPDKCKIE